MSSLTSTVEDEEELIELARDIGRSISPPVIEAHRKRHLAYLMAENGSIINAELDSNLPKQVSTPAVHCTSSLHGQLSRFTHSIIYHL